MAGADLARWLGANPLTLAGVRRLLAAGVDRALLGELTGAGMIGAALVSVSADGALFEPEGPDGRLLLGVEGAAGELVDVVALSTSNENEWAMACGMGDMLGEACLLHAVATDARFLRLFATPMAWLRAGGQGICVLQWNRAALAALRGLSEQTTLVVDVGAKERLRAMLAYGGLPQIAEDRHNLGRVA